MTEQQQIVYTALSEKILSIKKDAPILVAINGKDGSGKTMMANILADFLSSKTNREIIRISIDDFMNSRMIRYTPAESAGQGCYDYTFNFDGFIENVLKPLQTEGSWEYRTKIFDHTTDSEVLAPIKKASKDAIVIVDGVFLYKKDLVGYWDFKILLDTDDEVVIERGARRDTERLGSYEVARQKYIDRYIASQTIYYHKESPEKHADITIDNNDVKAPIIMKNRQVVGAIIRNHENEFLLQLRDDKVSRFKNCWSLFGGRVEIDEKRETALERELHEELGLKPSDFESVREVQVNKDTDGTIVHIYEIYTSKTVDQLILGEGAAMEYVPEGSLFDRNFAFNTEDVLNEYVQVSNR